MTKPISDDNNVTITTDTARKDYLVILQSAQTGTL
jgi:hypothetical protein